MGIEEVIAKILSGKNPSMILTKMSILQISEINKKELEELFRDLSRLVPVKNESSNAMQESIISMEECLLSEKEKDIMSLKQISENIKNILRYLVESQIKNPKTEELKAIFAEYVEGREPTQFVLAQEIIKDCDFILSAGSIFKKWTQIEKSIFKESQKSMCDQCPNKDTCDDREV